MAQTHSKVVIDGSNMLETTSLLTVVGSNWHVYGIEATNGVGKGISICGNNNVIEMCTVHHVASSGFLISRYGGEPNDNAMWPENNLVKNCEAYDCCDPGRSDADGFAAKLTCGEGNVFYVSVQSGVTKTVSTKMVMSFIGPAPSPVKSVNTGDTTPIMPLVVIMTVSAGICAVYAFRRKRA